MDGALPAGQGEAPLNRILVTGAGGFIGKRLASALKKREPTELRLASRAPDQLVKTAKTSFFAIETIDGATDWTLAVRDIQFVVHMAARVHVMRESATDALAEFRKINTDGTLRLARQAAAAGVQRFVFLSTVGVFGNDSNEVYNEASAPSPFTPYAMSKLEAEAGLSEISRRTGMELVIIRPPLVYGPSAPGNFSRLAEAIRWGIPLPLACVSNRRSLIGVDNLVDFIMVCVTHQSAANQLFLVSDGEDISTPDLIIRMAKAMHRPSRLLPVSTGILQGAGTLVGKRHLIQQLTGNLQLDCGKACAMLGWTPPLSVDEGLSRAFGNVSPS